MTKKTTGVSTKNSKDISLLTKKDVPGLLETVLAKIKAIKGDIPDKPKTEVELYGFGYISKITSLDELIKAHSSVSNRKKAYDESAKNIVPEGIKTPVFKLNGHSASEWIEDIKNRAVLVARENELEKLEKVKTTLESHLSEELKLAKDLKDLSEMLAD